MNNPRFPQLLAILLALLPANAVWAQSLTHKSSFPNGDAAWRVFFETSKGQGRTTEGANPAQEVAPSPAVEDQVKKPAELTYVDIVRKGALRRDQAHFADGTLAEFWFPPDMPVALYQVGDTKVQSTKTGLMGARRYDETVFTWISEKTFKGEQVFKGKKCQRYEYETPLNDEDLQRIYAWIDAETLRPVAWSDGAVTVIYQFDQPLPEGPLVMPTQFAEAARNYALYYNPPKRKPKLR